MSFARQLEATWGGGFFGITFIPETTHMTITPEIQAVQLVSFLLFAGCAIHGILASDHGAPQTTEMLNIGGDDWDGPGT